MPASKKDKQSLVLQELKRHGNISRAARAAGISRRTIWKWRDDDAVFNAAATAALKEGVE